MKIIKRFTLPLLLLLLVAAGCSSNADSEAKTVETLEYESVSELEQTSLGNNSAIINSVSALSGGEIPHKIEISSDTLRINYDLAKFNQENEDSANYWYNAANQERNVSFNSAILFTLIDNVNQVDISFEGETTENYVVTRDELASKLDTTFDSLDEETFKEYKAAFIKE
jgi:hypothetical protein